MVRQSIKTHTRRKINKCARRKIYAQKREQKTIRKNKRANILCDANDFYTENNNNNNADRVSASYVGDGMQRLSTNEILERLLLIFTHLFDLCYCSQPADSYLYSFPFGRMYNMQASSAEQVISLKRINQEPTYIIIIICSFLTLFSL